MTNKRPYIESAARRAEARARRDQAARTDHTDPSGFIPTHVNGDENAFADENNPSNFTKGLDHDDFGFVRGGYDVFVDEVNQSVATDFAAVAPRFGQNDFSTKRNDSEPLTWRGWESPRTGHYYDVQGPDADAVGMAPAPALGSEELTAEMAEVYAMALLRDVSFSEIEKASTAQVKGVLAALNQIPLFKDQDGTDSNFTKRRLAARFVDSDYKVLDQVPASTQFTGKNLFRGSGPGAKKGPWVSQFMVIGNEADPTDIEGTPGNASFTEKEGYIIYGSQVIDQRSRVFTEGLDYMTRWAQWLDVQKGADLRGQHLFQPERRFLTTPRDMATYVRFDALYQAYLNACLLLLGAGFSAQSGFPDQGGTARTGFASFGGPHILSLVTEVATRCLKFARRQKFNYHRRGRPERIGGLLTVGKAVQSGDLVAPGSYGRKTKASVDKMLASLQPLENLIVQHNKAREANNVADRRFTSGPEVDWLSGHNEKNNLLLAMAFPEGSPMHPAYAAGHATVAGGCVTMLKAFFETLDANDTPKAWSTTGLPPVVAKPDGSGLDDLGSDHGMTVEGELNKLAANISIARNMAGVHYYSDYYDSLRMGERVAVGMLLEQLQSYDEPVSFKFRSYDGDLILLTTQSPTQAIVNGGATSYEAWFFRHMKD